jgi:hypothetical protein
MTPGKRRALRMAVMIGWLILALVIVVPVLAQDGTGTTQPQGDAVTTTAPQDLNEVAARLAPLLVGAALNERTIEFLFSWSQRAMLDATSSLRGFATKITGLVQVDFRQLYDRADSLSSALVRRQNMEIAPDEGDPDANDPAHWPLEQLEAQLVAVSSQLTLAESQLKEIMASPLYKERKKMVAGVISIVMGIALAIAANLRLFKPLDITVADWFSNTFNVLDMIMAGVLMGLGTDWVHQVISVITKGQQALGRAGSDGASLDPELVKNLVSQAIQNEFTAQIGQVRDDLEKQAGSLVSDVLNRNDSPG